MGSNDASAAFLALGLIVSSSGAHAGERDVPLADVPVLSGEAIAAGLPTNPLTFVGIVPCRLADTRDLSLPPGYGPPALPAGVPRNFFLTGRCGIPAEALAVSANVTAVNPAGPGFLLIRPADGPNVVVSTLNFIPGQTIANGAAIPLGTGGAATVVAGVTGTELIIDVNGYFVAAVAGAGDVTAVTAGTGLVGGGTSGDLTLSVNTATVQSRVGGACPAGQSIRVVNQDGSVTCEPDDGTTYSAGSGLTLSGTTLSVNPAVVQSRVSQACAANSSIRAIDAAGVVTCEPDNDSDTTYTAGSGLTLTNTSFSVNTAVIQGRVTGTCSSAVRTINADGTVVCGPTMLAGRDLSPTLCNTPETITFSTPFSGIPTVVLTPQATTAVPNTFCAVGGVDATQFAYCCYGNTPAQVHWIAMR